MSKVMPYDEKSQLLGIDLTLKMRKTEDPNVFQIIAITEDGEIKVLYTYNSEIDGLLPNKAGINDLADEYARRVGTSIKVLIAVSDGVIWCIQTVLNGVTSIFGGFWAFGLFGIVVLLVILASMAVLWIYAVLIVGPLMALSYGLRLWLQKKRELATRELSRNSLEFARRCNIDL